VIFKNRRNTCRKEGAGAMSLFGSLIEIAVERPMIAGSVGAFIVGLGAAIVGQPGYAILLALIGTGLALAEIYLSSRG
jgi:hypothetical protein